MGEKKNAGSGSSKALYRKYRSRALSEVVGQEHVTTTLENALKQGKISHAYLLTGPRGTGKTSIARILAHKLNDVPYNDDSTHLDIIEIDAASNRRIDDIRDLREKVHIAPLSAKYKVYIIDEVHMLTSESFNALLKTLEEPPSHVIFILATTEVHKLPATILSRVQRHSLKLIDKNKVADHLASIAKKEEIKINQQALELLAEHGGGSLRDSTSLLDQMSASSEPITAPLVESLIGLAPAPLIKNLLKNILDGQAAAVLQGLEELLDTGLTPDAIVRQLIKEIRGHLAVGEASQELVKLMSDLLEVHSAQYPELKLQTTSLSLVKSTRPAQTETRTEISKPVTPNQGPDPAEPEIMQKDPKQEIAEEPIQSKEEVEPPAQTTDEPTASKNNDEGLFNISEHWNAILQKTKTKNNPLYTVLRLATPEIEASELLLIFNFPFHQKKLDEPKYKALVAEVVAEVSGVNISVKSIVDKSRTKSPEEIALEAADPAHASLVSSVQDIMGGGEVVKL